MPSAKCMLPEFEVPDLIVIPQVASLLNIRSSDPELPTVVVFISTLPTESKVITTPELAIKAKASKAAKLREEKKRQKRKIALMEGMVGIDGLANHFKKSGICRGCKGRVPVAQEVYVHRDDFRNTNDTPTVVCRGCIE